MLRGDRGFPSSKGKDLGTSLATSQTDTDVKLHSYCAFNFRAFYTLDCRPLPCLSPAEGGRPPTTLAVFPTPTTGQDPGFLVHSP